jgi:hypothetical protein
VGGWSLYAYEGRLKYCYNFLGIEHFMVAAGEPIPAGKHQVRMEFKYDGGGLGKGGDVTLYYDGKPVGQGRVERTQPMIYSADEACDVGADTGSPASPDYGPTGNKFPVRSTGCRSISATTAKITSSKPRTGSRSRWHGNKVAALGDSEVSGRHPPAQGHDQINPSRLALPSAGSVEEPQFEFHRLVIQDGQAVVITSVAVE